jgi:surfeit locus 1 family protein
VPGARYPLWQELRFPAALAAGATVRGAPVRPDGSAPFSAAPRPEARVWYHVDLAAMARTAALAPVADYYLAVPYVGTDGRAEPNPFARPGGADPLPPERHLGYALTWFGLAVMLMGVYIAYHINVGRLAFARKETD